VIGHDGPSVVEGIRRFTINGSLIFAVDDLIWQFVSDEQKCGCSSGPNQVLGGFGPRRDTTKYRRPWSVMIGRITISTGQLQVFDQCLVVGIGGESVARSGLRRMEFPGFRKPSVRDQVQRRARLTSAARSNSQGISRGGRPNMSRKTIGLLGPELRGAETAGDARQRHGAVEAIMMASNNCSGRQRRGLKCDLVLGRRPRPLVRIDLR